MAQPTTKAEWLDYQERCINVASPNIGLTETTLQDRIYHIIRTHSVFVTVAPTLGITRTHPWVGAIEETALAGGSPTFADVASRLSGDALTEFQNNSVSLEPMIEAILEREV